MVSLFNVINVNEASPHSPLKLKVWMEIGTQLEDFYNRRGRFFRHCFSKRQHKRFGTVVGCVAFCEKGSSMSGLRKGQRLS